MAETHPVRLTAAEIERQAERYFGTEGLGLDQSRRGQFDLRFEDAKGFVEIEIEEDSNNQSRLTIEHHGFASEIQAFRRLLAKQARAETSSG